MKEISDLELRAMQVLWHHQTCCVHMVHEALSVTRPTAYTTAQTILERLHKKDYVIKQHMGKKSIYQPKISKQLYATFLIKKLFSQLATDFDDVLFKSLAKGLEAFTPTQKQKLAKLIK